MSLHFTQGISKQEEPEEPRINNSVGGWWVVIRTSRTGWRTDLLGQGRESPDPSGNTSLVLEENQVVMFSHSAKLFLELNCWTASFHNVILDPIGSWRVLKTLCTSPLLLVITFNWGPVSGDGGDSRSISKS